MFKIIKKLIIIMFIFLLIGCKETNILEKEGYNFDDEFGWYVKNGAEANEIIINLTQNESSISKSYKIDSKIKKITFIGDEDITYSNLDIYVNIRSSDLDIEFVNFNYYAGTGKIGLDGTEAIGATKINISVKGSCSIKGGKGKNGTNGVSYNYNSFIEDSTPNNGLAGSAGENGCAAISGENISIFVNTDSKLIITGGKGGNGGKGGDGQGSKQNGNGSAGNGGNGATGGNGAYALKFSKSLSIQNNGILMFVGGNGGEGGKGGHGGENKDTGVAEYADDGGNGGHGGAGGDGGVSIYSSSKNLPIIITGNEIVVKSGDGGNGGCGGDGGSSCRNEIDRISLTNGGDPGNSGNGGNGGNVHNPILNCEIVCDSNYGKPGIGGSYGTPGKHPHKDPGVCGKNGENGVIR